MKVKDLHLGPLSTRRQRRRTRRSNHPADPREQSLQNQAAPHWGQYRQVLASKTHMIPK